MYFYDGDTIIQDFEKYGLVDFKEIEEPNKDHKNKPSINFLMVNCKKAS